MFRKYLTIAASVAALLVPMSSYAQQAPAAVPVAAVPVAAAPVATVPAAAAPAPARPGIGMELLVPLALLVVVAGAVAHNN
jgi:hypothetical protein